MELVNRAAAFLDRALPENRQKRKEEAEKAHQQYLLTEKAKPNTFRARLPNYFSGFDDDPVYQPYEFQRKQQILDNKQVAGFIADGAVLQLSDNLLMAIMPNKKFYAIGVFYHSEGIQNEWFPKWNKE